MASVTTGPSGLLSAALLVSSQFLGCALAAPGHAHSATILKRQAELREEYDYVVVGGGTAGLTIADRLTEDSNTTVLVLEYGYLDSSPAITSVGPPIGDQPEGHEIPRATRYYNVTTVPQPGLNNRTRTVPAGCVVGGSSAVNGMIFDRGSAEDYDAWNLVAGEWRDEYAEQWSWENLLPYFKKSVTFHPPDERMQEEYGMTYDVEAAYGGDTPIHSSYAPFQWPAQRLMWDAFKSVNGVDFPVEGADGHAVGVFWFPNSIDPSTRTRSYARLGHYSNEDGPHERANFHLLPAHRVTQLLLDPVEGDDDDDEEWEAVGVKFMPRDGELPDEAHQVRASREVIVAAGTVHSPQVLQRSGIGPTDVLEAAGVNVRLHLPGVGWNFHDHQMYTARFTWGNEIEPSSSTLQSDEEYAELARELWETNKTGPHSAYPNSGAFLPLSVLTPNYTTIVSDILAQDPEAYLPEGLDPTLIAGYQSQVDVLARQLNGTDSAVLELMFSGSSSFSLINLRTLSRGTMHISPDDDGDGAGAMEPIADYRALTNPIDVELNRALLTFLREFLGSEAMVETFDPTEDSPLMDEASEEFEEWLRDSLNPSVAHPSGTCALGPRELGGVVGPQLQVHGTRRLRVADCSIMTLVPGTHTSSTAYAIGEKAADLIRGITSV